MSLLHWICECCTDLFTQTNVILLSFFNRMYTDVDGLSGDAKADKERLIEMEYQVSKQKAAREQAIIEAKAETEKLDAIADKTSTEYKTKYTAAKEKVKKVMEAQLAGGAIDDDAFEKNLADAAKRSAGDANRACYETAMELDVDKQDAALAGCKSIREKAFEDTRMREHGETAIDGASLNRLMYDAAAEKAAETGAAFSKANEGKGASKSQFLDGELLSLSLLLLLYLIPCCCCA